MKARDLYLGIYDDFDAVGTLRDGFTVSNIIADCIEKNRIELKTLAIFAETNVDPDIIVPILKDILIRDYIILFEIFLFSPKDKYMENMRDYLSMHGKSCIYKMSSPNDLNMDRILYDWGREPVSNCFALKKGYDLEKLDASDIYRIVVREGHSLRLLYNIN